MSSKHVRAPSNRTSSSSCLQKAADGCACAEPVREMTGNHQTVTDASEIAWTSAGNRDPAQRAFKIGHCGELPPDLPAQQSIVQEMRDLVQPVSDEMGIAEWV